MAAKPPIVFKSEPALWAMLAECNPDGRSAKPFDMRRWDLADGRIYRLSWGGTSKGGSWPLRPDHLPSENLDWHPYEKEVSFLNKATGELLTFEYLGVEFANWAPGFGFILLGKRHGSLL